MGRTFRTMSTQTLMPRHVHNKDPLSKYAHADPLQASSSGYTSLNLAVGDCTTIVQSRSKLSGAFIVILTAVLKSQLDHENPELLVRVIAVDEP